MLFEHFEIDSRFAVIIPFQVRFRNELDEVEVAREVLREDDELVDVVIFVAVSATLSRELEFDPDDGFYPFALTGLIEFEGAVHVARVRERDGRHSEFLGAFRVGTGFSEARKK
ncbi:MAG: hypothetical protein QG650_711 [Patescibacteria group bacterium]|nr:hypothetical protein [Patescibacteria group bacterium]